MTPAQTLFLAALEQPPRVRDAFLARQAHHNPALLGEVRELLAAHFAPGILADWNSAEDPNALPERVGDWQIVRPLGEGGMGVVVLAERTTAGFHQRAAIKLVRDRHADTRLADRLARECRILARLEHPGIARLIDGGLEGGRPWFAMEFVDGVSLLEHARRWSLGLEERLALFLEVCDAVRYAHQQLVVHQDLKPGNIMVGVDGRVRLLDFGIAKVLEPTEDLAAGSTTTTPWVTPAYAAPEQLRGDRVTTLSDVHALGVVLYELLTDCRPIDFTGAPPAEIMRLATRVQPRPPSERVNDARLARQLTGDLDQICLTAMAKDASRRYAAVTALVDDIRRHLDGRPILARPDSVPYRARKFVARHRTLVAAAAITCTAMIGGMVVAGTAAARAARERDHATAQAAKAAQVSALLVDLFRVNDPAMARGAQVSAREMLDRGAERIGRELLHQPELQAALLREVAQVYANLGALGRAEVLAERALVLDTLRVGGNDVTVAADHALLGRIYAAQARRDRAIAHLSQAMTLRRALFAGVDTTLAHLAVHLGWQRRDGGDADAARALFAEAVRILQLAGLEYSPAGTAALLGLATLEHDAGQFDEANRLFEVALGQVDTSAARPDPGAATALLEVGRVRRIREQYSAAAPLLERAAVMRGTLYEPGHPLRLEAEGEWAKALVELGRLAEARAVLAGAIPRAVAALGEGNPRTLMLREALAMVDLREGRAGTASARLDSVLVLKQRHWPADHPEVVYTLVRSADAFLAAGEFSIAARRYLSARQMAEATIGTESVYRMLAFWGEARVARARGRMPDVLAPLDSARALAARLLRPGHRWRVAIEAGVER